jgi:prepilin-type N-terminal cleavage/methylation domain-containing protein
MPRLILRARRGFTLAELLVTMTLLAIVGTALTRVLLKQQQFYTDASRTADAKRELRLGATVLPFELRSVSTSGGDIMAMSESEITMRAYTGSSVICERAAGGDRFWIPPSNLAKHTLTTFVNPPAVGDTIFVFNENVLRGAEDDKWEPRLITSIDNAASGCTGAPYTDPVLDPVATKPRMRIHVDIPLPDEVLKGAVVRFTQPVRYRIYPEASGNWYLGMQKYSGGAWQGAEPFAGPYRPFAAGDASQSGLQFRYFDSLGTRVTNMALTTNVSRVDVFLRTNAGIAKVTERKGNALQDSVVMRVGIRNYR